jgi:hypothetical protein
MPWISVMQHSRAGRQSRGAHGELATTVAGVIRQAAARGDSVTAQAEQVLDELTRRGLLKGGADRPGASPDREALER